jgi:hypothetical protein
LSFLNVTSSSPFRDNQNRRLTKSLFVEYDKAYGMYTLKANDLVVDGKTYPSLYKLYIDYSDTTEYLFAKDFFEDLEHWNLLCSMPFFVAHLTKWRTELELKLKAESLQAILKEAREGKYDAHKFFATKSWIDKTQDPKRRGRPTKADIDKQAREMAFLASDVDDDLKRIKDGVVN